MDFGGTDAWIRALTFFGILAGTGALAWWVLSSEAMSGPRQLVAGGGAVAAIPAAIVAPIQDGAALTILGLLAIAGFVIAAAAALGPEALQRRTVPATPEAGRPVAAPAPAAPQTRVASNAGATEARATPLSEHTVALGPRVAIKEIAFLVDYSGDGHALRLGADNRIGRDSGSEVALSDSGASREHSRIKLEDGRFVLYDLGSTNGTRLVRAGRRRRLAAPAPLQDLDIIEIGETRLVFLDVDLPRR